eukprot:11157371-Lingulodinium_polyedra.AAC.1
MHGIAWGQRCAIRFRPVSCWGRVQVTASSGSAGLRPLLALQHSARGQVELDDPAEIDGVLHAH